MGWGGGGGAEWGGQGSPAIQLEEGEGGQLGDKTLARAHTHTPHTHAPPPPHRPPPPHTDSLVHTHTHTHTPPPPPPPPHTHTHSLFHPLHMPEPASLQVGTRPEDVPAFVEGRGC